MAGASGGYAKYLGDLDGVYVDGAAYRAAVAS